MSRYFDRIIKEIDPNRKLLSKGGSHKAKWKKGTVSITKKVCDRCTGLYETTHRRSKICDTCKKLNFGKIKQLTEYKNEIHARKANKWKKKEKVMVKPNTEPSSKEKPWLMDS